MLYKLINYIVHGAPYIEKDADGVELNDVVFYVEIESAINGAPIDKFIQKDFTQIKLPKTTTAAQIKIDLEVKAKDFIITNYGPLAA